MLVTDSPRPFGRGFCRCSKWVINLPLYKLKRTLDCKYLKKEVNMNEFKFVSEADGDEYVVTSPDEFEDYSEVDSTTVDSAKGAPA